MTNNKLINSQNCKNLALPMINDFGRRSYITWTAEDLRKEREAERDEQEDSVFSDNPDWYLRMCDDQRRGFADYE